MPTLTYYHYTSSEGSFGILRESKIKQSIKQPGKPDDVMFGPGVYLTTLPPESGKRALYLNNYDGKEACIGK